MTNVRDLPFVLHFAEPSQPAPPPAGPGLDLAALVAQLLPALGPAGRAPTEVLLLARRPDIDAVLLERELTARGVGFLRLNVEDIPNQLSLAWRFDGAAPKSHLAV